MIPLFSSILLRSSQFFEAMLKIAFPALGKSFGCDCTSKQSGVVFFASIQLNDLIDIYTALTSFDELNLVTGSNFSFPEHSEIEARTLTCHESSDDVCPAKLDTELVEGQPWFGDHHDRGANLKLVTDIEPGFKKPRRREVLAEHAPGQFHFRKFLPPILVVFGGVGVRRFAQPAMDGKISLSVAVEIERSEHHTSCDRLFENSCRYRLAIIHYDPGKTDIDGNELCLGFHTGSPSPRQSRCRSVPVDVENCLGKGLRRFLRQIMSDAALDRPVRILGRKFLGIRTGVRTRRTVSIALQGNRRHGDHRKCGKPLFQIIVLRFTFSQSE